MSNTLHRFTPPTCTLEIKGKKSALSRWTKQDLLQNFQFQLRFDDPRLADSQQVIIKGDRQNLEQLQQVVDHYVQNFLHGSLSEIATTPINSNSGTKSLSNQPFLQPKGLVNHELFFGHLNQEGTTKNINLSTVQLFDLVTALEAYNTQIAALPELSSSQPKKVIPLWGGVAAATVAAVGITTIALHSQSPQNVASSSKSESSVEIPQLNEVVPPQIPETPRKQTPKPKLREPLSSTKRLPPPPAVDAPKPKPDIPDPADYSLSQVARQSGFNNSAKKNQNKNPTSQQTESVIVIPPETKVEERKAIQDLAKDKQLGAGETPGIMSDSIASAPNPQLKTQINPNLDQESSKGNNSTVKSPQDIDTLGENSQDSNVALNKTRSVSNQLREVKVYFQEKWQPPTELKQGLEYRLFLNSDGSIKRVVPLGKAAKLYLNKTNIPVQGEPFISPIAESQKYTIRLLLSPDARVQAFTE